MSVCCDLRKKIVEKLEFAIKQAGLEKFVSYGVLTGSFALCNKKNSDVDIMIVLNDNVIDKSDIIEKIKHFSTAHLMIQLEKGFHPDWNFPVYFVTQRQIDEVLHGRPFILDKNNKFILKEYSPKKWIEDKESDYNVILFQLISHNFDIFCGRSNYLKKDTEKALLIIFLYAYQFFNYSEKESIDRIILCQDLFRSAGLRCDISERLQNILWNIMEKKQIGFLRDGRFFFHHQSVLKQVLSFTNSFYSSYLANHIVEWKVLSENAKKLAVNN